MPTRFTKVFREVGGDEMIEDAAHKSLPEYGDRLPQNAVPLRGPRIRRIRVEHGLQEPTKHSGPQFGRVLGDGVSQLARGRG